jgi:hypothetical protein
MVVEAALRGHAAQRMPLRKTIAALAGLEQQPRSREEHDVAIRVDTSVRTRECCDVTN